VSLTSSQVIANLLQQTANVGGIQTGIGTETPSEPDPKTVHNVPPPMRVHATTVLPAPLARMLVPRMSNHIVLGPRGITSHPTGNTVVRLQRAERALSAMASVYPSKYKEGDSIPEWIVKEMTDGDKKKLPKDFDAAKVKAGEGGFVKVFTEDEFDKDGKYGPAGPEAGGNANCGPKIQYFVILDFRCDEETTIDELPKLADLLAEYTPQIPKEAKEKLGKCDSKNCDGNKNATRCEIRVSGHNGIAARYDKDSKKLVECVVFLEIAFRCGCGIPPKKNKPAETGHGEKDK
jgi:hypothetical protein